MAGLGRQRHLFSRSGFSLMEILISLVIVGILIAVAVPVFGRWDAAGRDTACQSNLRALGVAMNLYLADHDMLMPVILQDPENSGDSSEVTLVEAFSGYADDPSAFRCPADPGRWKSTGTSYFWNPVLNGQSARALNFLNLTEAMTRIPVLSDLEGWHKVGPSRINILFADGHIQRGLQLDTGDGE